MELRMIKKITNIVTLSTVLIFTGCGGGGGSADPSIKSEIKKLTLTVGNTTIDSSSSLSRITTTITDANKDVTTLKMNKEGTISISGDDSDLFELIDASNGKKLSFINKPDASSPADIDQDGIYNIDIKAKDNDNQSVTYKAAYKIIIPRTTLDILNGNTYYIDTKDNTYSKVTYNESGYTSEEYKDTELVEDSTETVSVTYGEDSITFFDTDLNKNISCLVEETSSINLTCTAEGLNSEVKVTYLESAPAFITPDSYTLTAISANTQNNSNDFAPKIASFSVTGNAPSENNQVIISKSKLGGKFSYSVTIEDAFYAKGLGSGLVDGSGSIIGKHDITKEDTVNFDCVFNNDNGVNSGIDYTCEAVNISNTEGNADTEFYMYVCDKEDLTSADSKCSVATVPVLFTD